MNIKDSIEYIKAENSKDSSMIWKFSDLDKNILPAIIRGTWIFNDTLNVYVIKAGLVKILNYYPHLSGRVKNKEGIQLTNDGVLFCVADEPDLSVEDIKKKANPIKYFSYELKPSKIKSGLSAPFSIKITKLKDGSVLGIQCSHACMDGYSFYSMVNNWGRICNNKDFDLPVLDQSLISVKEILSKEQTIKRAIEFGWKKVSIVSLIKFLFAALSGVLKKRSKGFYFSTDSLGRLKDLIARENGLQCSTNVALSAFLSKMSIKLYKLDEKAACTQVTVVNARNRLDNIPLTFTGNASTTIATPPFSAGTSISEIARIIHETLQPFLQTPSVKLKQFISLGVNAMKHKIPFFAFDVSKLQDKKPTVFPVNNFSRLPVYDVDFGTGKPISVIPHDLGDQILIWPAPPLSGGVEVYFSGIPALRIQNLAKEDSWFREMINMGINTK